MIIKFAIVGYGYIGKRHAEMIKNNPEAELVAVCDVKIYSSPKFYFTTSIEVLLSSNLDIDVVCICTPNGLHSEQALKVLSKGINVLVEKPLGLLKNNCEAVLQKSLEKNKRVFCVMQNRYSPPSVWVKELIESKTLGDIFIVQLNCYWNRDSRYYKSGGWKGTNDLDGGTLFTQFSHFIDIMYWLFGDIENIQARFKDFTHKNLTEFEDSGIVSFDFVNGGIGSLNYSTAVNQKNLESSITIIGEKGSVKIGGQYMNEVEVCNIDGYEMPTLKESNPANDYGTHKGSAMNHNYVIQNVVDTIKERTAATTNAFEGLKVVDIIERIYKLK